MALVLYGIPTCSSCQKARRWLTAHDIAHDVVDLRTAPPSREQIAAWVASLGAPPRNTSGQAYRALDPQQRQSWSDAEWVEAFSQNPMLLKRPIIVRNGEAVMAGFRGTDAEILAHLGL